MILSDWQVNRDGEWVPAALPARGSDEHEHLFRTHFHAQACKAFLRIGGIATVYDVILNGETVLAGESMFESHEVPVEIHHDNELVVRVHPLAPQLSHRRLPRARWRSQIADSRLRWFRTSLLGRCPGFAPGPPIVGPWRPVSVASSPSFEQPWHVALEGTEGVVRAGGEELRIPNAARWWPHTHGRPVLHEVTLGGVTRKVGFRSLLPDHRYDSEREGLSIRINGVELFARGAVWTPTPDKELRPTLERARDAGMNIIRLPGTGVYESEMFHDICDELGILVWQDFMFANFDYPVDDDRFRDLVERETRDAVKAVAWRPSLAIFCGGSELQQQPAMLGLDQATVRSSHLQDVLRSVVSENAPGIPYVPSVPTGGDLPFRFDVGVANYFGVGGYRRPLQDARLSNVCFAAECLAFSNSPFDPPDYPVPGDIGASWDFGDVSRHYLAELYGVRSDDEARQAVTGEVMAEVLGEWRRQSSPCAGAIVLWLRDVIPGAGWGLLDHLGRPKAALGFLAEVMQPIAVWMTDEGLGGFDVHIANDREEQVSAILHIAVYRELETRIAAADELLEIPPHSQLHKNVEGILGRFIDASYAYRFGPPGHDLVTCALEVDGRVVSQAFRFPDGRPDRADAETLGLELAGDVLRTRKLVYGIRAGNDVFSLFPGGQRKVKVPDGERITAVNLKGALSLAQRRSGASS